MDARAHWEQVYRSKGERDTSWFRAHLDTSLELIAQVAPDLATPVIDVGGGRATLVDDLLARGYADVTVLDLSAAALEASRARLGARSGDVAWIEGDITSAELPTARYGVWHDRAVFHFLAGAGERARYVANAARAIRPGGHAIVATFAPDGPEKCSGLPVRRYDAEGIAAEFGPDFTLVGGMRETHRTPWDTTQSFQYATLKRM